MLGFDDGTVWIAGKRYELDKNNPGRLTPWKKNQSNLNRPVKFLRASARDWECGDEVQTTRRLDCSAPFCYVLDSGVGGDVDGPIKSKGVEMRCTLSGTTSSLSPSSTSRRAAATATAR